MVSPALILGGASLLGGIYSGQQQMAAQQRANQLNALLAQIQLGEGARQFDIGAQTRALDVERASELSTSRRAREDAINRMMQERFGGLRAENLARLDPYAQAGRRALGEQQALMGLAGPEAGEAAYGRFTASPGQRFLREQQEKALLRNTAAIGGLGGGNVRQALQEQAFGRAQTDYANQLARLGALGTQGFQAARGGLEAGYGPGYIQTGADVGVATETPTGPVITPSRFNLDVSGGGGGGMDLRDLFMWPGLRSALGI